jgi:hypothetical protein
VEAFHEHLTQEGFGTSEIPEDEDEEAVEEGMVCKDTGDSDKGDDGDDDDKKKKAKKDDDSEDDGDGDDKPSFLKKGKGGDKGDDGDKKKPSFLKKEENLDEAKRKSLKKMLSKGSYVPGKGGSKGYVGGSGDHGK